MSVGASRCRKEQSQALTTATSVRISILSGTVTDTIAALAFSPVEPNILVSGCKSAVDGPVVVVWDITSEPKRIERSLSPEPSSAVKSFKVPGDILHIDFHPSGAHFAVTCTITLRDEAFFFRRSTETGEWEQRLDIGLGGSLGNVNSEEVCHDSTFIGLPAE